MDDMRKALGEVSKQFVQVSVCADGFRHIEQGAVLGDFRLSSLNVQMVPHDDSVRTTARRMLTPCRRSDQHAGSIEEKASPPSIGREDGQMRPDARRPCAYKVRAERSASRSTASKSPMRSIVRSAGGNARKASASLA